MTRHNPEIALRSSADPASELTDAEFALISDRIHRETGIVMGAAKRNMLISRLSRRLRARDLPDFASYIRLLDGPDGAEERSALISAITTNVTGFFREPHHFEALRAILPDLLARMRSGGRVRLWSAGCSTGQEPYRIAATILDMAPDAAKGDLRILATDIDPIALEHGAQGIYERSLLGDAPPAFFRRFLVDGPAPTKVRMAPALQDLIRFEVLNLLEPWPFQGQFDVIFCRNVVIYFDPETRRRLWGRFAQRLPSGSTLFIGHSERMDPQHDALFASTGTTQYRRTAQIAPPL